MPRCVMTQSGLLDLGSDGLALDWALIGWHKVTEVGCVAAEPEMASLERRQC